MAPFDKKDDDMPADLRFIAKLLEATESRNADRHNDVKQSIDKLNVKVDAISNELADGRVRFERHESRIERIERESGEYRVSADEADNRFEDHSGKYAVLRRDFNDHKQVCDTYRETIVRVKVERKNQILLPMMFMGLGLIIASLPDIWSALCHMIKITQ